MAVTLDAYFRLHDLSASVSRQIRRREEEYRREAEKTNRQLELRGRTLERVQKRQKELNEEERKHSRIIEDTARRQEQIARTTNTHHLMRMRQLAEEEAKLSRLRLLEIGRTRRSATLDLDIGRFERAALRARTIMAQLGRMRAEANFNVGGIAGGAGRGLIVSGIAGGLAALVPVLGAAVPLIQGLAAAAAAAGPMVAALATGIGSLVAVGIPFVKQTTEAWKNVSTLKDKLKEEKDALKDQVAGTKEYVDQQQKVADAQQAYQEAYKKLTPAQKELVRDAKALKNEWTSFSQSFGKTFAPLFAQGVGAGRKLLGAFGPQIGAMVHQQARILGGALDFITSPGQMKQMKQLFEGFRPLIDRLATSFGNVFKIVQGITLASIPMAKWLTEVFNKLTGPMAQRLTSATGIQNLQRWLKSLQPTLVATGNLLKGLWNDLRDIGRAVLPETPAIIDGLTSAIHSLAQGLTVIVREIGPDAGKYLRDLGQFIGTYLAAAAPILHVVTEALDALLNVLNALPGPVKTGVIALGGLAFAFGKLGLALHSIELPGGESLLTKLLPQLVRFGPAGIAVALGVGAIGAAIYGMTHNTSAADDMVKRFNEDLAKTTEETRKARDGVRELSDQLDDLAGKERGLARERITLENQKAQRRALDKRIANIRRGGVLPAERDELAQAIRDRRMLGLDIGDTEQRIKESRREIASGKRAIVPSFREKLDRIGRPEAGWAFQAQKRLFGARLAGAAGDPRVFEAIGGEVRQALGRVSAARGIARDAGKALRRTDLTPAQRADILAQVKNAQLIIGREGILKQLQGEIEKGPKGANVMRITQMLGKLVPPKQDNKASWESQMSSIQGTLDETKDKALQTGQLLQWVQGGAKGPAPGAAPKATFVGPNQERTGPAKPRQHGGVAWFKELTMLGEAGPEAVIPLSAATRYQGEATARMAGRRAGGNGGGGAAGKLIHIENFNAANEGDWHRLEEMVVRALQRAHANVPMASMSQLFA